MKDKQLEQTAVEATTMPNKKEKRISISIKMLEMLLANNDLAKLFIETLLDNPDIHAPVAIQVATAILRQTKLDLKND